MPPLPGGPPHLLLLPWPPSPATRPTLNAAYRTSITSTLTKLGLIASSSSASSTPTRLVIALTAPVLTADYAPKIRWKYAQSLLSGLYTILAVVCAEHNLDVDFGDGAASLDATIILVDHAPGRTYRPSHDGSFSDNNGTVIRNLAAFASRVHPWATVFHPSSESGFQLLSDYLSFAEGRQSFLQAQLVAVDGGLFLSTHQPASSASHDDDADAVTPYKSLCLGGTFDHLHPGHKLLLQAAALLVSVPKTDGSSEFITATAADELLKKKKFSEELQPWDQRARGVIALMATTLEHSTEPSVPPSAITATQSGELRASLRDGAVVVRCSVLLDPFGPPIHEEAVAAIVVSAETRSGGTAINDKRREKGWSPLDIFEIDILDASGIEDEEKTAEDFSTKISSTMIRQQRAARKAAA